MSTINVSLPESLKDFVEQQVTRGGYGTSSEYVREVIHRDSDRLRLRGLLREGGAAATGEPAGTGYFAELRKRVTRSTAAGHLGPGVRP